MNYTKSTNIFLAIVVIALVGAIGYLLWTRPAVAPTVSPSDEAIEVTASSTATPPATPPATPSAAVAETVNWESLLPSIRPILAGAFSDVPLEESAPLSISQTDDITGDGVPEALVNLGTGGAHTQYLALMRIEDGQPVVVSFTQQSGSVAPALFLSGASVMNGDEVGLLSDKQAIYSGYWSRDGATGSVSECSVAVFQWQAETKTFDFNGSLGDEIRPGFCQKFDRS